MVADYFEPDPYTRFQIADRALNTAIVQAEITRGFEEYLEIFDEFYADDIEVTGDTRKEPIRGKKRLRSLPELLGHRSHNGRRPRLIGLESFPAQTEAG